MDIDPDIESSSWFKDPTRPHPFRLVRTISSKSSKFSFQSSAIFPWKEKSLGGLWKERTLDPVSVEKWKGIVDKCWDMVAVGSKNTLFIFYTHKPLPPIVVQLKPQVTIKMIKTDKMHVAWAMEPNNFEPLVIFNHASNIYIYNIISQTVTGSIRGHGGAVTSIAVHPVFPHFFCSTSRDFTTRVYNLMLKDETLRDRKKKPSSNPHWPPSTAPSLAGAAHGLRLSPQEIEGHGVGRCIGILLGGRSGGHNAAVMAAAFHPNFPLIATCGMDRAVKIWFFRFPQNPNESERLIREDKPLFSTQRIHRARVLSITWLSQEILVTHSAPTILKDASGNPQKPRLSREAGEMSVWQWLSFDRFFPVQYPENHPQVLRGCSSDYQESSSFKILATYSFPNPKTQFTAPSVSVFHYELTGRYHPTNKTYGHDPLALIIHPYSQHLDIVNIALFRPRDVPHITPSLDLLTQEQLDDDMPQADEEEEEEEIAPPILNPRKGMVPPMLKGWRLRLPVVQQVPGRSSDATHTEQNNGLNPVMLPDCSEDEEDDAPQPDLIPKLLSCSMGVDGQLLVGVGTKGSLWVWTYDADKESYPELI